MKKNYFFTIFLGLVFCIAHLHAQTPQELRSYLPDVSGWNITDDIEVFNRDNLYNRINGAAPLFLENNFQEMTSMEYTKGDDYITIQAYRHSSPEDAFGMYASERSSDMTHFDFAGESQGDDMGLFFFSGNIYVKMFANNESEAIGKTMREIGKGLADKIDPDAAYPDAFMHFPIEGKVPYSQAYITANYIGHEFLKPAYTIKYVLNGREVEAFVIDGKTSESAKEILKSYFTFTKQGDELKEGQLMITDRYNGNIPVVWKGRYIIGSFDQNGEDFNPSIYDFLNKFTF